MIKIFIASANLILLSAFAFCETVPKNAYDGVENKVKKFYGELFLMPSQTEALDILTAKLKEKQKSLKSKIALSKTQKTSAIYKKDFAKAKEETLKISSYETEIETARIEYMKSLTIILNDEEYDRLNEMLINAASEKQKTKKNR
ncbi:MAG: hypothetical protein LBO62_01610 [Endomicrobium sp.]|jgi:hypothetical protein|nr:hypothetical protein [Endomicrobium sp.]